MADLDAATSTRLAEVAVHAGLLVTVFEIDCPRCGNLAMSTPDDPIGTTATCREPGCGAAFRVGPGHVHILYDFGTGYLPPEGGPSGGTPAGHSSSPKDAPPTYEEWTREAKSSFRTTDELCGIVRAALEELSVTAKGPALEESVGQLFSAYPALFRDDGRWLDGGEKDRVITVLARPGTEPYSWGAANSRLYVDCKNEKTPYTSEYASIFLTRLRTAKANCGLIVAPRGITREQNANAAVVLRDARLTEGIVVGVVDAEALLTVCNGTPWWEAVHNALLAGREGTKRG